MKKKFLLTLLGLSFMVLPSVSAEEITGSWATRNEGILKEEQTGELTGRYVLENSLYDADVVANNYSDNSTFTGVGYYDSITYYFHKLDENNEMTHYGRLVNNPDETVPDLRLTEVTWGNDNSTWTAEGVAIYAVDYNGTGEEKLIGYAYNKVAEKRASSYVSDEYPNGYVLPQVEGAKIEYAFADSDSQARNLYDTLVYFNEEFESAAAIKLVDITEDLKFLGGSGQADKDGYDLDAIYGYRVVLTSVVQDVTYVVEGGIEELTESDFVVYEDLETYSEYTVLPNMFEKEGYEFVVWATDGSGVIYGDLTKEDIPNYSTEYDYYAPNYVLELDESYTFYGVWEEVEDDKPSCGCNKKPSCDKDNDKKPCDKDNDKKPCDKDNNKKPSCDKDSNKKPSCDKDNNKKPCDKDNKPNKENKPNNCKSGCNKKDFHKLNLFKYSCSAFKSFGKIFGRK